MLGANIDHLPDHADHHRRAQDPAKNGKNRQADGGGRYDEDYGEPAPSKVRAVIHEVLSDSVEVHEVLPF